MKLNVTANLPTQCPECGSELQWDGVNLVCANEVCSGKRYYKLYKFIASVGGNGIKGFGHSMINDIIEISTKSPLIKEDSSIEEYMQEAQVAMNRILNSTYIEDNYGPATAKKYKTAFENMLVNPVDKSIFLWSMNIKGLGWKTCQQIVANRIFDKILNYDTTWEDDCYNIKGIGQSVVQSLYDNANYIRFMAQWIKYNFIKNEDDDDTDTTPLRYITVTGSLQSMSRSDFDKHIREFGWAIDANISNSEYLVTNNPDPTSSKGKKAKALGKPIITEVEFLNMIKGVSTTKSPIEVGELCE